MTPENQKSATQVQPEKPSLAKTSVAYWLTKVKIDAGKSHYSIQIAHQGRRQFFGLSTAEKATAAGRARKIYLDVVGKGWEQAIAIHRPEAVKVKKSATIGALIEAATRLSSARRESLEAYAKALRRLAAGSLARKSKGKRTPSKIEADRATVDTTPLDELTPAAILAFKNAFLKSATSPEERGARAITFNSLLRNSKALVSKKVRSFIEDELSLPSPLWFEGVSMEQEPSLRYRSKIDAAMILEKAQAELAEKQPEVFKALMLTLALGLRRSEADSLTWEQFDFEKGEVDIRDTADKSLKSKDSAGVLGLDASLNALFRQFYELRKSEYVLTTPPKARRAGRVSRSYRCDRWFNELVDWLRAQGVTGKRPIHVLRKEVGSVIASSEGIFAASRFLRHSDIRITSRIYADTKKPVASGLGQFLTPPPEPKNIIEGEFNSPSATAEKPAKPIKTGKKRA